MRFSTGDRGHTSRHGDLLSQTALTKRQLDIDMSPDLFHYNGS